MNKTINISLSKDMYEDAKKAAAARRFSSISEFIRNAIRRDLYERNLTVNGFTPEFEEEVLRAEAEPEENDEVWETEEDIHNFFKRIDEEVKQENAKNQKVRRI